MHDLESTLLKLSTCDLKKVKKHELLEVAESYKLFPRKYSKLLLQILSNLVTDLTLEKILDMIIDSVGVYELYSFLRFIRIETIKESMRIKLLIVLYNAYNNCVPDQEPGNKCRIIGNAIDYMHTTFTKNYSSYKIPKICEIPISKFNIKSEIDDIVKTHVIESKVFSFYPEVLDTKDFNLYSTRVEIPIHYIDTTTIRDPKYKSLLDFYPDLDCIIKNQEWMKECSDFLLQPGSVLSFRDRMTMYGYIRTGSLLTTAFGIDPDSVQRQIYNIFKLNLEYYYLPFYFQLLDLLSDDFFVHGLTEAQKYMQLCDVVRTLPMKLILKAAHQWKDDFDVLFQKCPKTKSTLYVYRGEKTLYASTGTYTAYNYQSSSISPTAPLPYANLVFKRIMVPAGTRLLYIQDISFYQALEAVLPENSKYKIISSRDAIFYINAINHQKDIHDKYKLCTPLRTLKYLEVELVNNSE
jgi:hypothetical protein